MLGGILNTFDPVARHHPLNRGRVAWWLTVPPLDGGSKFYDLMGLNPGTLTNMTTSASGWRSTTRPGGWGHVLFDASNDSVSVTDSTIFAFGSGDFTIGAWALKAAISTDRYIFSHQKTSAAFNGIGIYSSNNSVWKVETSDGTLATTSGTATVVANTWYRVLVTRVGATISIYLNGALDASGTGRSGSLSQSVNARVGSFSDGSSNLWNGAIDDVTIWNRALSASEVFADYELSRRGYPGVLNRMYPITFGSSSTGLLLARRKAVLA